MSLIKTKDAGFLLVEIIIAIIIIGTLMTGIALSLNEFRRFNGYQLLKQRCIAAGQAQLDSIAAGGEIISDEEIDRLWPAVKVMFSESAGAGQWEGLKLVEIKAVAVFSEKTIEVELSRYLRPQAER